MSEEKNQSKNLSIYIPEREIFNKLCDDNTRMWYNKTGKMMTKSEVLIKSLLYFRSFLKDEVEATPHYSRGIRSIGRLQR